MIRAENVWPGKANVCLMRRWLWEAFKKLGPKSGLFVSTPVLHSISDSKKIFKKAKKGLNWPK